MKPKRSTTGWSTPSELIASVAQPAYQSLGSLIALWGQFRTDNEPTIRLLALIAAFSAFGMLVILIALCVDSIRCLVQQEHLRVPYYLIGFILQSILFGFSSVVVLLKLCERTAAIELENGIKKVIRARSRKPMGNADRNGEKQ